jgi:hypothetical protein
MGIPDLALHVSFTKNQKVFMGWIEGGGVRRRGRIEKLVFCLLIVFLNVEKKMKNAWLVVRFK